ncbi:MAG: phosphate:acyl-[acyl carrier protein] acyltransferase [Bryobacterales bacterium]|nr:phosphate:acyl-[acyl carrier protein] acyltransferase [Bryobacterales bacterium]
MLTIAVDALGGDHAPRPEVEGAIRAARSLNVKVALVGQEALVRRELEKHDGYRDLPICVVNASERITMEDSPAKAARSKKDSSMHVGSRLVVSGDASGFVSAGNTGACMAIAKMVQGKIRGVDRPALSGVFPSLSGKPVVMVDVGANVDCTPEMLAQFAVMGEIYSRVVLRVHRPRVGLLSIGEEEHKGNELTKAATPLLKALAVNFIGNVEGRDLYSGTVDVIVCDGFVGNVALKVSEGLAEMVKGLLRESLEATITRKIGYVLSKAAFTDFRKRTDYAEYGGAALLGVKGVCIICHGRSDANAIKNAIRVAADFSTGNINQQIEHELR